MVDRERACEQTCSSQACPPDPASEKVLRSMQVQIHIQTSTSRGVIILSHLGVRTRLIIAAVDLIPRHSQRRAPYLLSFPSLLALGAPRTEDFFNPCCSRCRSHHPDSAASVSGTACRSRSLCAASTLALRAAMRSSAAFTAAIVRASASSADLRANCSCFSAIAAGT